jgi:hypothetical protein
MQHITDAEGRPARSLLPSLIFSNILFLKDIWVFLSPFLFHIFKVGTPIAYAKECQLAFWHQFSVFQFLVHAFEIG